MKPDKDIYDFIEQKILWCLNNLKLTKASKRILFSGLLRLHYFNLPGLDDCNISFSDGENHFYIFCGAEMFEISDYHSVDTGMGFDQFQTFCYKFFFNDDKEYNDAGSILLEKAQGMFHSITAHRKFKHSISTEI